MSGKEVIEILDKCWEKYRREDNNTLMVNPNILPDIWDKIKDDINEFYFLKYWEKSKLALPVPYYYDSERCTITGIYYKRSRKTITVNVRVSDLDRSTWWSYLGILRKSDLLDENYKEKTINKIKEARLKYLNNIIERALVTIGKASEEIEKIEKET